MTTLLYPRPSRCLGAAALLLLLSSTASALFCDVVRDCGVAANATELVSDALSACVARCAAGGGGTLAFPAYARFNIASVDFSNTSGLTLSFGEGSRLQATANVSAYPVAQFFGASAPLSAVGNTSNGLCYRAVLFGRNVTDLLITGPRSAVVDGAGPAWWPIRASLPYQAPKLLEFVDAAHVRIEGMTYSDSANWHLHAVFSSDVTFSNLAVLGSRVPGGTDGIDPHSCTGVVIEDSLIDVGDDAIAVTSGPHDVTGELMHTRNVTVRRCFLRSRNFAIGSATFANVSDVTVEDSTIGDDNGSAPWAIKIKSHCPYGGVVRNVTFQRLRLGRIAPNDYQQPNGGYAISISANYANSPLCSGAPPGGPKPPFPPTSIADIAFIDIVGHSAVWAANPIVGVPHGANVTGLLFRNVSFGPVSNPQPWVCRNVSGTRVEGKVEPPPPAACLWP